MVGKVHKDLGRPKKPDWNASDDHAERLLHEVH